MGQLLLGFRSVLSCTVQAGRVHPRTACRLACPGDRTGKSFVVGTELRIWVRAYDREAAWSPRYFGNELGAPTKPSTPTARPQRYATPKPPRPPTPPSKPGWIATRPGRMRSPTSSTPTPRSSRASTTRQRPRPLAEPPRVQWRVGSPAICCCAAGFEPVHPAQGAEFDARRRWRPACTSREACPGRSRPAARSAAPAACSDSPGSCSRASATSHCARSRSSFGYFLGADTIPTLPWVREPPPDPGRFTLRPVDLSPVVSRTTRQPHHAV